jgi:hypothetical protein
MKELKFEPDAASQTRSGPHMSEKPLLRSGGSDRQTPFKEN